MGMESLKFNWLKGVRYRTPGLFYRMLGQIHVNGWSHVVASQNGGSTDYIFPLRLRVLQWSRHLFNYWKNKKTIIEKFLILLIWNWIYIDHRKLHGFGPKYNLIKYMVLFPSYNLEIENYKDKHWSINLWSKFGGYVTRWEGVRHPSCSVKPVF